MSPFLVYLMMQADSIGSVSFFICVVFGFLSVVGLIGHTISNIYAEQDDEAKSFRDGIAKPFKWSVAVFFIAILMQAFVPSTKTIAVMVVLPKVTSPQALDAMGSEAKDIYLLAKDALRSLSKEEKPKEPAK